MLSLFLLAATVTAAFAFFSSHAPLWVPVLGGLAVLGVLLGFFCIFPLLVRREKKPPKITSETLLQQAQQQMREAQAKSREWAVQTITQKNNLQALVDQTQKRIDRLTEKAEATETPDNRQEFFAERDKLQKSLPGLQESLALANTTVEAVKTVMRREEERIRALTAEALALGAVEKQAKIEIALAKGNLAMTTNLATDLFVQAREKIRQTKTQRDLIAQIVQTVETLDTAAQEAEAAGNAASHQKLTAARDALRDSALNAALWKL